MRDVTNLEVPGEKVQEENSCSGKEMKCGQHNDDNENNVNQEVADILHRTKDVKNGCVSVDILDVSEDQASSYQVSSPTNDAICTNTDESNSVNAHPDKPENEDKLNDCSIDKVDDLEKAASNSILAGSSDTDMANVVHMHSVNVEVVGDDTLDNTIPDADPFDESDPFDDPLNNPINDGDPLDGSDPLDNEVFDGDPLAGNDPLDNTGLGGDPLDLDDPLGSTGDLDSIDGGGGMTELENPTSSSDHRTTLNSNTPKKKRGRPRKKPRSESEENENERRSESGDENQVTNNTTDNAPGVDALDPIDPDLLKPFFFGWVREVKYSCIDGNTACDVFYWPPKWGRRKRTSKPDQEKYFSDFPSKELTAINFCYVKRVLGLNNEAYEQINYDKKTKKTRQEESNKRRKVVSYEEIPEHEGLLSESEGENEEISEEMMALDLELPISLQVRGVSDLNKEHTKRKKRPDRSTCSTPPLAADLPWTYLDDDPLGVFTEIAGTDRPQTPPTLRALQLTDHETATSILEKIKEIRESTRKHAEEKLNEGVAQQENLASHDFCIKKFKNYQEKKPQPPPVLREERREERRKRRRSSSDEPWSHKKSQGGQTPTKPLPMCSIACPVEKGYPRDLECSNCQRLFHNKCQRVPEKKKTFICIRCSNPDKVVGVIGRTNTAARPKGPTDDYIRVQLPMDVKNGKRPPVELVMMVTEDKFQAIKFTNDRKVTEKISRKLIKDANEKMKTVYQRSNQVGTIGKKTIFVAINPGANAKDLLKAGRLPFQNSPPSSQQSVSDQVSILVKPCDGNPNSRPLLLNVPRKIAEKAKVGTTLSFKCPNEKKYTVLDTKIHPALKGKKGEGITTPRGLLINWGDAPKKPEPINPVNIPKKPMTGSTFNPCSPFCPGASGVPELECQTCHTLFHPKCVGIDEGNVEERRSSFKCRLCSSKAGKSNVIDVIDLD